MIANNLKQEGESCGSSSEEVCGNCDLGLECDAAPFDACGQCITKPGKLWEMVFSIISWTCLTFIYVI